jgi:hypothetical protein
MTDLRRMSLKSADDPAARAQSMDAWFTAGRFAALLAGLIIFTFFNVVSGQETFYFRDFGIFGFPLAYYQREAFWHGEAPLWNPLNYCGIPFLAQWNTMCLYPLSIIYLVFPLSWSLGVFNLTHLFIGGMGMYFLARRCIGNNLAASVAGIVFAFNGLTWHCLMWPNDIAGLGWMPWVVMFVERSWRQGGRQVAIAALAGAMQMLTGAPEIILLTWTICGVMWLAQFLRGKIPRPAMVVRSLATGLLVAGIAAAQLLPFLDLLKHSHRDESFGGDTWPMPFSGLANFIEPLFHCSAPGYGVAMQYNQYWTASYFVGVGTLLLAVVAAWRVRKGRVWLLAGMTLVSVLMALGRKGLVYAAIKTLLPQLGFMRYPIKFVVVAVFALPLLAAYGVQWMRDAAAGSARERKSLQIVAAILLVLLGGIVILEWKFPMGADDWSLFWKNAIWRAGFLVLVPGTLIFMQRPLAGRSQLLLRVALLVLLWIDVSTHAPTLSPTVVRRVYEPNIVRQDMHLGPEPQAGEPRVMQTAAAAQRIRYINLSKPADDYLCRRLSLYANANLLDGVPKIDGFYSLYLREMAHILGLIYDYDGKNIDLKGLKDFLGVAHISATDKSANDAIEWVNRTNYLPLVTAGQQPFFVPETNTLINLINPNFDPRTMVILPPEAKARVTATNRTDAKITSPHLMPQRLEMQVTASAPSLVVLAQAYYHPWRAYVDGKRTELWRANYAFQALEVPGGQHQVSLVYEDSLFHLGVAISLGSLALCAVLWFRQRNKSAL